jgi:hypothetical protein
LYDRIQVKSSLIRYRSGFPDFFGTNQQNAFLVKTIEEAIKIRFLPQPNFASAHQRVLTMAGTKIDPNLLENGQDTATCPACLMVLEKPSSACPEGHVFCRECLGSKLPPLP